MYLRLEALHHMRRRSCQIYAEHTSAFLPSSGHFFALFFLHWCDPTLLLHACSPPAATLLQKVSCAVQTEEVLVPELQITKTNSYVY